METWDKFSVERSELNGGLVPKQAHKSLLMLIL